ncbi:MAG: hypothetical protein EXS11_09715, partial [Gemmataceae bacterium]|nr:hypothetical protein [Gemmataceae bacterium]
MSTSTITLPKPRPVVSEPVIAPEPIHPYTGFSAYMGDAKVASGLALRAVRELNPRVLAKAAWLYAGKGFLAVEAYRQRLKRKKLY